MAFLSAVLTIQLVVLFVRWLMLRSKLRDMEERIASLAHRVWILESAAQPIPAPPPRVLSEPVPEQPPPPPFVQSQPQSEPGRSLAEILGLAKNPEWEALIGGSILNKLGALVLVIGIALFLGYSFDRLTPAGRASIALGISVSLLATGVSLERRGRYQLFSRGLIGAGWAALYATSYAAYALPAARVIQSPFLGSILLLSVAGAMVAHSLHYRAQAITAVAFFAAFAALAATPNSPFAVLALVPLAASLLYLASRFVWYWLPLFGLAATYLTCASRGHSDSPLPAAQSLFLVYWLLFEAFDLIRLHRRAVAGGLPFLAPLNALGFLALSLAAWSDREPHQLSIAVSFGAALFLADTLVRAYLRPPSSFAETDTPLDRLRAGSFEGSLVVSAALAGLAIVGGIPGVWSSAALALEAEILYIAGLQLASPFLRFLGAAGFVFSLGDVFFGALTATKVNLLGQPIWNWTPATLFHAGLFYVNRALRQPNPIFSHAAAILVAIFFAANLNDPWVGAAWALFGAALFELGCRLEAPEFLHESYVLLPLGAFTTFAINLIGPHAPLPPLAVTLALAYLAALRRHPTLQIGATAATAALSALLVFRLAPRDELAIAWMVFALLFLSQSRIPALKEFRVAGVCLAALAFMATLLYDVHPARLLRSLPVVAGLYAAQYLMRFSSLKPEATGFSVFAALLLCIVLYGRVSGGLLTVAWGCEGLALLAAGFPLGQRTLRLQGLVLLLVCILKLFLFDLANLETLYRILSFVALGVILLGVSWIYTRFQDKIKKLL